MTPMNSSDQVLKVGGKVTVYRIPSAAKDIEDVAIQRENFTVYRVYYSDATRPRLAVAFPTRKLIRDADFKALFEKCLLIDWSRQQVQKDNSGLLSSFHRAIGRSLYIYPTIENNVVTWSKVELNTKKLEGHVVAPDDIDHRPLLRQAIEERDEVRANAKSAEITVQPGDLLRPHRVSYKYPTDDQLIVVTVGASGIKKVYRASNSKTGVKSHIAHRVETVARLAYKDRRGVWKISSMTLLGARKFRKDGRLSIEQLLSHEYEQVRALGLEKHANENRTA